MEGNVGMGLIGENFDSGLLGRLRDDDYESRSGSENFDDFSGDDLDAADDQPKSKKKKKYHRHTPQQIQELETFFKECPHPDEKQRTDLSKKLGLANKQVKFWFQNRRTQMKTQLERHENMILRQENERLRAENSLLKDAMSNPTCSNCGGPAIPGQFSPEDHQLRVENARLKEELGRVSTLTHKFFGRPVSAFASITMPNPNSGFELGMGRNGVVGPSNFNMSLPMGFGMGDGVMGAPALQSGLQSPMGMIGNSAQQERAMLIDLAEAAMDELISMSQPDSPLWIKSLDGVNEVLNYEEYAKINSPFNDPKQNGFVTEATRQTGLLLINSAGLVETMLDADQWAEMFPCMIAGASTLDVISSGMNGTRSGSLKVMQAEVQLPSPLVPVRQYSFLRFAKQHVGGIWVVVDVSVNVGRNAANGNTYMSCKKLPSGCILEDLPNGFCKVTWVDHSQYDESVVHQAYRPLVNSGNAFGAHRWVATLQRKCDSLAVLMSQSDDPTAMTPHGKKSMLKLAQRMSDYFWSGICPSSACKWEILPISNMGDSDMKIMYRQHPDATSSIVLSAATSVWIPLPRQRVFDFLREAQMRGEWDALSNGGPMQEVVHIAKGQALGNSISILSAANNAVNPTGNEGNSLYLQDSWTDSSGSMVVYSPIDSQSLDIVISGGESSLVPLLPSGFSILQDGHSNVNNIVGTSSDGRGGSGEGGDNGGCLLTFGLQMLLNNTQTSKLTMESVESVNAQISVTLQRIKDALGVVA